MLVGLSMAYYVDGPLFKISNCTACRTNRTTSHSHSLSEETSSCIRCGRNVVDLQLRSRCFSRRYGLFGLEPVPCAGVLPLLKEEERCWVTRSGESWSP